MNFRNKNADKASGLTSTLKSEAKTKQGGMPEFSPPDREAEAKAVRPVVETTGGVRTIDPSVHEVDSKPWNPPKR